MDFLDVNIQNYIGEHTSPEPGVLEQLNRETNANVLMPGMMSGHIQGRLLAMFSKMIRPSRILEIGTFTGYSAICLAEGLKEGGKLITIDINEELEELVRQFFVKADVEDKISFIIGNALEIVPKLEDLFDLVFIDADKVNYLNYYNLIIDKVRSGGFIIADNVLWKGKVVLQKSDKDTQIMLDFNKAIHNDGRVENVMLPVRDGLMIIRKL